MSWQESGPVDPSKGTRAQNPLCAGMGDGMRGVALEGLREKGVYCTSGTSGEGNIWCEVMGLKALSMGLPGVGRRSWQAGDGYPEEGRPTRVLNPGFLMVPRR